MPGFLRRFLQGGDASNDRASTETRAGPQEQDTALNSNSDRISELPAITMQDDSLLACVERPFFYEASRGDFAWALAMELGQATRRDEAIAHATSAGWMSGGREGDEITRAEAATVLVRALALDTSLPEGQVAYFADVGESDWFFTNAHAVRRHGLFKGSADNAFRGNDRLSVEEARIVVERARSAGPIQPTDQSPGMAPVLTPQNLDSLLSREELTGEDIARARDLIARMPEEQQAERFQQLNGTVDYRNQRDNDGRYALPDAQDLGSSYGGDVMCNVTSIAMALNQLGIHVDESSKQFEDLLDEVRAEEQMGSRYGFTGQKNVAEKFGASSERVWAPAFGSGSQAQQYFEKLVLPRLQKGAAATLSIAWGARANNFHIVRLQWVESGGLRIDDPYGRIYDAGGYYTYDKNAVDTEEGQGAKGEDNLWSWDTVAKLNGGRYVQFLEKLG